MFLFIPPTALDYQKYFQFKYISCSYLSLLIRKLLQIYAYLNTSHVLIYRLAKKIEKAPKKNLNTSHVLIYQNNWNRSLLSNGNLNTSHVLIYHNHLRTMVKSILNLNTSHVLIYQKYVSTLRPVSIQFKYISCSYLSSMTNVPLSCITI